MSKKKTSNKKQRVAENAIRRIAEREGVTTEYVKTDADSRTFRSRLRFGLHIATE